MGSLRMGMGSPRMRMGSPRMLCPAEDYSYDSDVDSIDSDVDSIDSDVDRMNRTARTTNDVDSIDSDVDSTLGFGTRSKQLPASCAAANFVKQQVEDDLTKLFNLQTANGSFKFGTVIQDL